MSVPSIKRRLVGNHLFLEDGKNRWARDTARAWGGQSFPALPHWENCCLIACYRWWIEFYPHFFNFFESGAECIYAQLCHASGFESRSAYVTASACERACQALDELLSQRECERTQDECGYLSCWHHSTTAFNVKASGSESGRRICALLNTCGSEQWTRVCRRWGRSDARNWAHRVEKVSKKILSGVMFFFVRMQKRSWVGFNMFREICLNGDMLTGVAEVDLAIYYLAS